MPNFVTFSPSQLLGFLFIFTRVASILLLVPVIGGREVPMRAKIGLVFILSIVLLPIVKFPPIQVPNSLFALMPGLAAELLIGTILGFTVRLIFAAVQLGGQIAGFQMGMAIANVIDPISRRQVSVISQSENILAMLLFVTVNAHYWFIFALVESFHVVPPFGMALSGALLEALVTLSGSMFIIAIKIAAPLIATLLFSTVALGLLAKTVPQMNVFIMSMPLNIGLGLIMLSASLPVIMQVVGHLYGNLGNQFSMLLRLMGAPT